jgi:hypothetical protein
MHGHAGWLVDNQAALILKQNMFFEADTGRFWPGFGRCNPDGRNPHGITGTYLIPGTDTPTVHPHFPTPQNAVDMAFWDTLQVSRQKVVDALPGFILRYINLTYFREAFRGCLTHFLRNLSELLRNSTAFHPLVLPTSFAGIEQGCYSRGSVCF